MTAKPTITDGEIEQEAREQLAVAAHGDTLKPVVRVCTNCQHCKELRDYRNFDSLAAPPGYYCHKRKRRVAPDIADICEFFEANTNA